MATTTKTDIDKLTGTEFPISDDSRFPDKFDVVKARQMTKDVVIPEDGESLNESDPIVNLYFMLQEREAQLRKFAKEDAEFSEQNKKTKASQRKSVRPTGRLEQKSMFSLHMNVSAQLFQGRDPEIGKGAVPSLYMFGGATTRLFNLSSKDAHYNPWANWALCRIDRFIDEIQKSMTAEQTACAKLLELHEKQLGVRNDIVANSEPIELADVNFMSPYGYQGRDLIAMFDKTARMLHTCRLVGLLTQKQEGTSRFNIQRKIRGLFNFAWGASRNLTEVPKVEGAVSLVGISAADLGATANEEAQLRVARANNVIGHVDIEMLNDEKVLNATLVPQFFNERRRRNENEQESAATGD